MHLIGFILGYPFIWLLSLLPLRVLYVISDNFLYPIIFHLIGYRKKVVYENLRNSFPEKNKQEIDLVARKFYRYFCDLFLEIIKLLNMSKEEYTERVKYNNTGMIEDLYKKGISIIAATGHYCNWEYYSGVASSSPYLNISLYKPLSNPYYEKVLATRARTRFGAEIVAMNDATRKMLSYRRDGKLIATCFITDQTPSSNLNYWTTFLNQDTPVFLGVEKLARSFKQAVVYLKMTRPRRGYYEVEFVKLYEDVSNVKEYEITESHVRELEKQIMAQPEYWLWTHRRWKRKKPANVQG